MDIISHALWPVAIFQNARWKWKAFFWGIVPDLGMIGPLAYLIFQDGIRQIKWIIPFTDRFGIPYLTPTIPDVWMFSYYALHSLVVWAIVLGIIVILTKKMYWPLIGWGLHILFDMFLHGGKYATQIFFPISDWAINSPIGWQDGRVLLINWITLFVLFGIFAIRKLRQHN